MRKSLWRYKIETKDGYTYSGHVRASSRDEALEYAEKRVRDGQRVQGLDDLGPIVIVSFAQFDCKDQVAIYLDYPHRPYRGQNTDEERILLDMQLEYMLHVLDAQEQVKEKYMPLLEDADARQDPVSEIRRVYDEHYKANRTEWDKVQRLYYA